MKNASQSLIDLVRSRKYVMADLYEITLISGSVLRYTTGDADITFNGATFAAGGVSNPLVSLEGDGGKIVYRLGVDVETFDFDLIPRSGVVGGLSLFDAARMGLFDGALVTIYRAVMQTYGDVSAGVPRAFVGYSGPVSIVGQTIHFSVKSVAVKLNTQLPRNVYSATCINQFGDQACAFNIETMARDGVIDTGTTVSELFFTMVNGNNTGFYDLGKVKITSGDLNGYMYPIKHYIRLTLTSARMTLWQPTPALLSNGTTIRFYTGCDKTLTGSLGCSRYSNRANFRGHPYVPAPETAA